MPDLDLSWPSPALADASAEVLADLSICSECGRPHGPLREGTCAPSDGGDAR